MSEIKQGQRAVPSAGMNVLGAYRAGRGTPTGTGLQPEAEQMIRLAIIGQLTDIRKAELDIARQGLTSYSNIAVTRMNAQADVINALSNMARSQQMDRQTTLTMLSQVNAMMDSYAGVLGQDVPEKAATIISNSGLTLTQAMQASSGTITASNLVGTAVQDKIDNRQLQDLVAKQLGGIAGQYINNVAPTLQSEFRAPGMDVRTIVDTKNRAEHEALAGVGLGYDNIISKLPNTELGQQYKAYLSNPSVRAQIETQAIQSAYERSPDLKATNVEKKQANNLRKAKAREMEIFRRQIEDSGISMSPAVVDSLNNIFRQTDDIIALGPDGFAEKMQNIETPVEMSIAKQKLEAYLGQIDNPTDKLSQSVARFMAEVPYAENYMAAMGFKSPLQTVRYLRNNPEEFREYYRIASRIGRTEDADQLLEPEAIRERLRVAGSSNAKSMFRRKNLTKPVERLVGFGINRPEGMRYFAGTNTSEQLDAAIRALRDDPENFDTFVQDAADAVGDDQATKEATSTGFYFAQSVPEEKRERVARAAERFRRRIGAEPEEEKTGRFVLPGLTTEMVAPEERPVLSDAPPPAKPPSRQQPRSISVGSGGVKSRKQVEAEIKAEEDAELEAEAEAMRQKVEAMRQKVEAKRAELKAERERIAAEKERQDREREERERRLDEIEANIDQDLFSDDVSAVSTDEPAGESIQEAVLLPTDTGSPELTSDPPPTTAAQRFKATQNNPPEPEPEPEPETKVSPSIKTKRTGRDLGGEYEEVVDESGNVISKKYTSGY